MNFLLGTEEFGRILWVARDRETAMIGSNQ